MSAKQTTSELLYKKHPCVYREWIQRMPPWSYYVRVLALKRGAGLSRRIVLVRRCFEPLRGRPRNSRQCCRQNPDLGKLL